MIARRFLLLVVSLSLAVPAGRAAGDAVEALEREIADAARTYDLDAATAALAEAETLAEKDGSSVTAVVLAHSGLVVAELLRIDLEAAAGDRRTRRSIGARIDDIAERSLAALGGATESSETARMMADLLATMMRSDYRAQKYELRFRSAVHRALELDERNARAWVSAAKPFLFAPPGRGRDPDEAVRLLTRALEFEDGLESALLLRAYAHELRGEPASAIPDLEQALDSNPACAPAREQLERLRKSTRSP